MSCKRDKGHNINTDVSGDSSAIDRDIAQCWLCGHVVAAEFIFHEVKKVAVAWCINIDVAQDNDCSIHVWLSA